MIGQNYATLHKAKNSGHHPLPQPSLDMCHLFPLWGNTLVPHLDSCVSAGHSITGVGTVLEWRAEHRITNPRATLVGPTCRSFGFIRLEQIAYCNEVL
jgi:hypothetical protein